MELYIIQILDSVQDQRALGGPPFRRGHWGCLEQKPLVPLKCALQGPERQPPGQATGGRSRLDFQGLSGINKLMIARLLETGNVIKRDFITKEVTSLEMAYLFTEFLLLLP